MANIVPQKHGCSDFFHVRVLRFDTPLFIRTVMNHSNYHEIISSGVSKNFSIAMVMFDHGAFEFM